MDTPFKKLYDRLPVPLQNLAVSGFSILLDYQRYGGRFREFREFLDRSQWFSAADLRAYQDERLAALIDYAYAHVPYYRCVMDERGLKPADIRTADDLHKMPLLTKEVIRARFRDLLSDEFDLKREKEDKEKTKKLMFD